MKVSTPHLWRLAICCAGLVMLAGEASAQQAPGVPRTRPPEKVQSCIGNPAARNFSTGAGWVGRTLGLRPEWGVMLGRLWLADTNLLTAGGQQPGGSTNNSALFVGLSIDAERRFPSPRARGFTP